MSVTADDALAKRIAALSEFTAKLDTLEQAVDDIALTAALSLLKNDYPEWEFRRASGFDSVNAVVSNDLGAVSSGYEYGMGKVRGAIARNEFVSDEQREHALQLIDDVKNLILAAYELEGLIDSGEKTTAGHFYRTQILEQADEMNGKLEQLTKEIEQTIKFAAL